MGDFALKECGVLAKRLQHRFFILTQKRLYEHGRVPEVWGHAHFGYADKMRLEHVIMDTPALEQLAQHMPHLLADSEQSDGSALSGFLTAHLQRPRTLLDLEHLEAVARLDVVGIG